MDDARFAAGSSAARILVIVVLYKMQLAESRTMQGLFRAFASSPELHDALKVLIWDNSPTPFESAEVPPSFTYRHSQENLGVSGAYNRATGIAEAMGCQWLLLLDQDTAISDDFLLAVVKLGGRFLNKPEIAAVVPFLMDGDRILSPFKVIFKRLEPMRETFEGVHPGQVSAANSGTLMRIEALRQIGGFDENFWLDFSDVVMFHRLHQHGKQVYIAGDLKLQHKITVLDFNHSMSPQRYANFLAAEGAYWNTCRTVPEGFFYTLRILERAFRQMRRLPNPAYARITFACFLRRIFLSKKQQSRRWKLQSAQRDIPLVAGRDTQA